MHMMIRDNIAHKAFAISRRKVWVVVGSYCAKACAISTRKVWVVVDTV